MPIKLSSFVDIHTHILPGIDDGPKSMAESYAMAEFYSQAGVSRIFATPHFIPGTAWAANCDLVRKKVWVLNYRLKKNGHPLRIIPGMEIAFHKKILDSIRQKLVLPLGESNTYLLEPSFNDSSDSLLQCAELMLEDGYGVIIAHPERIPCFQESVALLLDYVRKGVQLQVTIDSLTGKFGRVSKKTSLNLIQSGAVHYLASDAHGLGQRCPPNTSDWQKIIRLIGKESVEGLCIINPRLLLKNGDRS